MNVTQLANEINSLSDESEEVADIIAWVNDAIAKINIELDANFPYLDVSDQEMEPAFPETWQRALLIPFGVGRVKQKDSSQFEYTDAYNEFMSGLQEMKAKYTVPEEYRNQGDTSSFPANYKDSWYSWTGGW